MSSAANHRKRSHRSQNMHRQYSTKHMIRTINKMNKRLSFIDRAIGHMKKLTGKAKESNGSAGDN